MTLFRVDSKNSFTGPHQGQATSRAGVDPADAGVGMILIHGRGASAQSMLMVADEINREDIHFRALQASRHTWYPNSFLQPAEQNQPGLNSGLQYIYDTINDMNKEGIPTAKIVLLGFSQGACLTSEFVARHPRKYGGVIALSGGMIGHGPQVEPTDYTGSLEQTPVFLGCSDSDPHIPEKRVNVTAEVFEQLQASVEKKIYPNMGHTVNQDELNSINTLLDSL